MPPCFLCISMTEIEFLESWGQSESLQNQNQLWNPPSPMMWRFMDEINHRTKIKWQCQCFLNGDAVFVCLFFSVLLRCWQSPNVPLWQEHGLLSDTKWPYLFPWEGLINKSLLPWCSSHQVNCVFSFRSHIKSHDHESAVVQYSPVVDKILACERQTFLLAHHLLRSLKFARRNVCNSVTEIPYWWRKSMFT